MSAGIAIVKAFNLRRHFFHTELFRTPSGRLCAIEINLRPPGGPTVDMWNYSSDMDIFAGYAKVLVGSDTEAISWATNRGRALYYCGFAGRRNAYRYKYTDEEVARRGPASVVLRQAQAPAIAEAMGDDVWIFRSPDKASVVASIAMLTEEAPEVKAEPESESESDEEGTDNASGSRAPAAVRTAELSCKAVSPAQRAVVHPATPERTRAESGKKDKERDKDKDRERERRESLNNAARNKVK
eukprot:m51a1_g10579 hypothetical protein (242) ;mRNA; r:10391-11309